MKKIRLDFCDFWPGFSKQNNFFMDVLRQRYDVEIYDKPDFVIYANYGHHHRLYTCPRIFFTGEANKPDFRECDYALTHHYSEDTRHLRLPFYVLYVKPEELIKQADEAERVAPQKTKFCGLLSRNPRARERIDFMRALSRYQKVDSGGTFENNMGAPIGPTTADKLEFLRPYKFNIAFENQALPGYTTEKICEAMRARCIPIYWGSSRVQTEFNPRSFLNFSDFPSTEALIERIKEIDAKRELYLEYLREPYFLGNQPNEFFSRERLLDFFERIFCSKIQPVGTRRAVFQLGRWVCVKKDKPMA